MRILIHSPTFLPVVGGHVQAVNLLATQLTQDGHDVCVVSQTKDPGTPSTPFRVAICPGFTEMIRLARWSEVVLHANVSLKNLWSLLLVRRPWIVWHHGWYFEWGRRKTLRSKIKPLVSRLAVNVACSHAVAQGIPAPCEVISGPYDDAVYHGQSGVARDRDLLFVGRLIHDKGADILMEAVASLRSENLRPSVTITGSGPEEASLRRQVKDLDLEEQVRFTGVVEGIDLASLMNRHRITVVPSRWHEPFGLVALEAIACGCLVIGSEGGGLKEAIGPCGFTFPNENVPVLAGLLRTALAGGTDLRAIEAARESHLGRFTRRAAADAFTGLFQRTLQR